MNIFMEHHQDSLHETRAGPNEMMMVENYTTKGTDTSMDLGSNDGNTGVEEGNLEMGVRSF